MISWNFFLGAYHYLNRRKVWLMIVEGRDFHSLKSIFYLRRAFIESVKLTRKFLAIFILLEKIELAQISKEYSFIYDLLYLRPFMIVYWFIRIPPLRILVIFYSGWFPTIKSFQLIIKISYLSECYASKAILFNDEIKLYFDFEMITNRYFRVP